MTLRDIAERFLKKQATIGELRSAVRSAGEDAGRNEFLAGCMAQVYAATLPALKGRFTAGELKLMLDLANSLFLQPGLFGQQLPVEIEDSHLDNLPEKWAVDQAELLRKLDDSSLVELGVLELWTKAFWDAEDNGAETVEMYVNQLR